MHDYNAIIDVSQIILTQLMATPVVVYISSSNLTSCCLGLLTFFTGPFCGCTCTTSLLHNRVNWVNGVVYIIIACPRERVETTCGWFVYKRSGTTKWLHKSNLGSFNFQRWQVISVPCKWKGASWATESYQFAVDAPWGWFTGRVRPQMSVCSWCMVEGEGEVSSSTSSRSLRMCEFSLISG